MLLELSQIILRVGKSRWSATCETSEEMALTIHISFPATAELGSRRGNLLRKSALQMLAYLYQLTTGNRTDHDDNKRLIKFQGSLNG